MNSIKTALGYYGGDKTPAARIEAELRRQIGTRRNRSVRSGLQFPVGRVHRHLRVGRYAKRVTAGAPVYLAGVLEYLAAELLEMAGNAARDHGKARITPRHLMLAVRNDEELNRLLGAVTVPASGTLPNVHAALLPKQRKSH